MLTADKNATFTGFQIQTMQIREKELDYFVKLYNTIAGMAAFLAGFAFKALTTNIPEETNFFVKICFLAITASCVGLELCAMCISASCTVFGPGMFLRGAHGLKSADLVIEMMHRKSELTVQIFMAGLIGIVISSSLKSWCLYHPGYAFLITVVLAVITILLYNYGLTIFEQMYVKRGTEISGRIDKTLVADPTNVQFQQYQYQQPALDPLYP